MRSKERKPAPVKTRDWFNELDEAERLLVAILKHALRDAEAGDADAKSFLEQFAPELLDDKKSPMIS